MNHDLASNPFLGHVRSGGDDYAGGFVPSDEWMLNFWAAVGMQVGATHAGGLYLNDDFSCLGRGVVEGGQFQLTFAAEEYASQIFLLVMLLASAQ
jgi:hypothetical protein